MINIQVLKVMFNKMDSCIKMNRGGIKLFYRIRYGMGIVWNYLRYKATISDYFELRFFEKNSKEKKEYLTSKDGLRFAQYVDSQEVFTQLCSKKEMYRELKKYVKRDQLYSAESTKEDFEKFVDKHNSFLYKPDVADCGRGIEKWTVSKGSIEDLYNKFKKSPAVLDELVTQHQELSKLNPSSVNTIRIFTVMIGNECEIIGAALRMGVGDTVIDNYSAGGVVGSIDEKTGIVRDDGEDAIGRRYEMHPTSKIRMKGFKIPNWETVIEFVRECAQNYPLKYVAWDIAIRENDCVLIEANPNGMANVIQIAGAKGRKKQYEELRRKIEKIRRN